VDLIVDSSVAALHALMQAPTNSGPSPTIPQK